MSASTIIKVDVNDRVLPITAKEGTEIILRGAYTTRHDGSIIDAATTTWPKDAPGGASVDPVGFFDLESGGLHLTSRDLEKHEVHAIVTNTPGKACSAAGIASPCLVQNDQLATKRLLIPREFNNTLSGTIELEVPQPLPPPIVPATAVPILQIGAAMLVAGILGIGAWRWKKRQDDSPEGRLISLSRRVMAQLERADQVVAAPLKPTVDAAIKAIREKRVDAASKEGKRVAEALRRVNERLETTAQEERAAKEQEAADELLREMESALEAAEEMKRTHP